MDQNGTHCDLGFGQWVRVGESKSRHIEWQPKSVVQTKKRDPEHLALMRQLDQELDENARTEIIRLINEVRNRGGGGRVQPLDKPFSFRQRRRA
jgi:hypothetical protein